MTMDPATCQELSTRYQLMRTLKDTIYGKVKLGKDRITGEHVAVKLSNIRKLKSKLAISGQRVLEDPLEEMQILRDLNSLKMQTGHKGHKHIVRLLTEGQGEKYHYGVLEFASKGELFAIVEDAGNTSGRVPLDTARRYFYEIALGLSCLHEHSIVHLDLSLENVLINAEDQVKICDFGMARRLRGPAHLFNLPGSPIIRPGKVRYMAPEVFAGEPFDGKKADMFAIGVNLFVMLTGLPPFDIPSMADSRWRFHARGQLRRLLKHWGFAPPYVPELAVDLLEHLLCKEEQRYTIDQVLAHPFLRGVEESEEEEEEIVPEEERPEELCLRMETLEPKPTDPPITEKQADENSEWVVVMEEEKGKGRPGVFDSGGGEASIERRFVDGSECGSSVSSNSSMESENYFFSLSLSGTDNG